MNKLLQSEINVQHFELIEEAINQSFVNPAWILQESLTRGLSNAALYKIQIAEDAYIARLDDPQHPHNNLEREYHAMNLAAQRFIAPEVRYTDPKNGIVIMKFIESVSLDSVDFSKPNSIKKFSRLISKLHNCSNFQNDITVFQRVDTVFGIMNPELRQSSLIKKCIEVKNNLERFLSEEQDLRPCHCDINLYNLLYDGNKLWLVDWNAASQQSFYFDLACCAVFFYFYNNEACHQFLADYFSREVTAEENSKFYLMKIFVSIYYGIMFIYLSGLRNFPCLTDSEIASLPTYSQFMRLIGQGIEKLDNPHTQQKFGFIFLKQALSEFLDEGFSNAIAVF